MPANFARLAACRAGLGLVTGILLVAGCGYTTRGLYPQDIHTIAVPVFKSNVLRRDIEWPLTEMVIQKIEAKTPLKVVGEDVADTVLRGTISDAYKAPFGLDGYGNPRGGVMVYEVSIIWEDRRTGEIINQQTQQVSVRTQQPFLLDLSQSNAAAQHDAINRLADQIVSLLQTPW